MNNLIEFSSNIDDVNKELVILLKGLKVVNGSLSKMNETVAQSESIETVTVDLTPNTVDTSSAESSTEVENTEVSALDEQGNNVDVEEIKPEAGLGVDASDCPWDKRIHSSNEEKNANGTWRLRKKPKDLDKDQWKAFVLDIRAELKGEPKPSEQVEEKAEVKEEVKEVVSEPVATLSTDEVRKQLQVITRKMTNPGVLKEVISERFGAAKLSGIDPTRYQELLDVVAELLKDDMAEAERKAMEPSDEPEDF